MLMRILLAVLLVAAATLPALAQSRSQVDTTINTLRLGRSVANYTTLATSGTIDVTNIGVASVIPIPGNVTDVILEAGNRPGQTIFILNKSGNTITFAASGTSNVANGTSQVVAANAGVLCVWDADSALWFCGNL